MALSSFSAAMSRYLQAGAVAGACCYDKALAHAVDAAYVRDAMRTAYCMRSSHGVAVCAATPV